jgi:hypothetical protein|tara:strand:+ start:755 stop:1228 length:474 start_codon:yes stop_codon:yes gene_type:complete
MGILAECEKKISHLNSYKFNSKFKPRVKDADNCVGSYFLFKGSKRNHHLAQKSGKNGEFNIIATIQSLSTLATMVDILCDVLLDKDRELDFELMSLQGKHNSEVGVKAKDLMLANQRELIQEHNAMTVSLANIKDKYHILKAERAKMKAYVKRHFKI